MLENFNSDIELKFKELSPEEKQARGILGRLYGPIADIVKPTRNGRRYTNSLWEKVFQNPIIQEMFSQGGIPGELDHPVDRDETDSQKIAIMMPEPPTKDKDGHLIGYFDILDTPCGRIAYALAKYGFKLGVSSRGSGDTYEDYTTGEEMVDEDTYSFNAFDLVLLPAAKDARLKLAESLDTQRHRFTEAMDKMLEDANEGDKKIMTETLDKLKFVEDTTPETEGEENTETVANDKQEVADNNGTELVESLQQALKDNKDLQKQVLELQEKLSVSYTKEMKLVEENTKLKGAVNKLTESVGKAQALNNQIGTMKVQLNDKSRSYEQQKRIVESYRNRLSESGTEKQSLMESIKSKDTEISTLKSRVAELTENTQILNRDNNKLIESLSNEISELKKDSEVKNRQYSQKVARSNKMVESYKATANEAIARYIDCKATQLGITANEIKNKLNENYSFNDIDKVCESLRSYKRNMSKLPFNVGDVNGVTSKGDTSTQRFTNPDDVLDASLFELLK